MFTARRITLMPATRPVAFSDRYLKAVKPALAGKRVHLWDAACPNLGLRVSDTGRKTFYLVKRVAGKVGATWFKLGRFPYELSLAQAREKARSLLADITEGKDPKRIALERKRAAEREARDAEAKLFRQVAEQFSDWYEKRNLRRTHTVRTIRRELVSKWGDWPANEITHRDVIELVQAVVDRGQKVDPKTGRRSGGKFAGRHVLGTARMLFGWAYRRELIDADPTSRIIPRELHGLTMNELRRDRVLSDGELKQVWNAAGQMHYPFGPLVRLLLLTGSRLNEIAQSNWNEFDLEKRILTVPAERMKMKAAHVIPLCDTAMEIIEGLPRFKHGDYVFSLSYGAKPMTNSHDRKKKLDALVGDDVKPYTLHDLRRTARTGMAVAGVTPLWRNW
jgi:integrase